MPAVTEVSVPDLGDFAEVPVIEIHVAAGEVVSAEDPLITLESDKATMDIPSPAAGTVRELRVKVGDLVSRGSPILLLDTESALTEPPPLTDQQEPPFQEAADPLAAAREPARRSAEAALAAGTGTPGPGTPVTAVEAGPPADFDGVRTPASSALISPRLPVPGRRGGSRRMT
jgi:pyruvate dehydrogenase E2 component (dihydrolipoamide acetyltransferase)